MVPLPMRGMRHRCLTVPGPFLNLVRSHSRGKQLERYLEREYFVTDGRNYFIVNVTVENLAACKKLVRFEIDAQAVDEAFETVTKDYMRQAALPGFRPGKAPRDMVLKKYEKDIEDEAKRKLIGDAYRQGVKDQKL